MLPFLPEFLCTDHLSLSLALRSHFVWSAFPEHTGLEYIKYLPQFTMYQSGGAKLTFLVVCVSQSVLIPHWFLLVVCIHHT